MNRQDIILLDIDGVLIDFDTPFLDVLRRVNNLDFHANQHTKFKYSECVCTENEELRAWETVKHLRGWVYDLPLYDGALAFLRHLRTRGRVVACTAPAGGLWASERHQKLLDLGFSSKDIVLTHDKSLVNGDYLIDDAEHNISSWEEIDNARIGILLHRRWNAGFKHHTRCHTYREILDQV